MSLRIAVLRAGAIGDTLMATPVASALRKTFPDCAIDFVCAGSAAPLLRQHPDIDEVWPLHYRNLPYLLSPEQQRHARRMRRFSYRFAVVLESAPHYCEFLRRAGIAEIRGFHQTAVDPALHSSANNLRAAGFERWQDFDLVAKLNIPQSACQDTLRLIPERPEPLAGMHVGYGPRTGSSRQGPHLRGWPLERFIQVGRNLAERGFHVVLVGAVDRQENERLAAGFSHGSFTNLWGRTDVVELAALMKRFRLFVSVDSGPAHLAAAVSTPLLVMWGPAILQQTRPLSRASPVLILRHPVYCAPCFDTRLTRTCRRNICMEHIQTDDALRAIDRLLANPASHVIEVGLRQSAFSVSVVIPSFNGRDLLERFLPSVKQAVEYYRRTSGQQAELVVVEDGGSDGTAEWITRAHPDVRFVQLANNVGFPAACNRGFSECRFPLVLLLNNDVRPDRNLLAPLVRHFSEPSVFAVTCRSYDEPGGALNHTAKAAFFRRGHWSVFNNIETEGLERFTVSAVATGGFSMFDAAKLRELGGFDELYSPYQYEDFDLSYRAWKRDWAVLYEPDSVVHHRVHSTIDRYYSPRRDYIISQRNRLMLHWKNLHQPALWSQHVAFVILKATAALFTLDTKYLAALGGALARLPQVWRARRREIRAATVGDDHLRLFFRLYLSRPGVRVYWERKEMFGTANGSERPH